MPSPSHPDRPVRSLRRPATAIAADDLHQLARLLAEVAAGDAAATTGSPALVRVRREGEGVELACLPAVGDAALALRRQTTPTRWQAVGVTGSGRAHQLDSRPAQGRVRVDGPGQRIGFALLVGRDGTTAGALATPGDQPGAVPDGGLRAAPEGRLVDACLRSLGRPTPAPGRPVSSLWTGLWLDAVLAATMVDPAHPPTWPELLALHPALASTGPHGWSDEMVEQRLAAHVATTSWSSVRREVAQGRLGVPGLEPADAAWFDDGSFSRAALELLPEVPEALATVSAVAGPALAGRVAALVLQALRADPGADACNDTEPGRPRDQG